jgi:ATP-dependent exoDNAse (exonuclease V) alpha subunit
VSGGPGTGKTTTCDKVIEQLIFEGFMVLVTATTAAAALRFNTSSNLGAAQTLHRAAQLPLPGRPLVPMHATLSAQENNPLGTAKGAMEAADVLFCDEMSMLTVTLLYVLISRMRQATREKAPQKVLVLVGDHAQLPPVCRHKLPEGEIICKLCHIMYSNVWQTAKVQLNTSFSTSC